MVSQKWRSFLILRVLVNILFQESLVQITWNVVRMHLLLWYKKWNVFGCMLFIFCHFSNSRPILCRQVISIIFSPDQLWFCIQVNTYNLLPCHKTKKCWSRFNNFENIAVINPFKHDFTLPSSSTTSRELLSQFSTCSGWRWFDVV